MRLLGNRFKKLQCLPLFLLTWASFTHSGSSLGPIRECCPHRSLPDCPTPQCPQDWVLYQEGQSETSGSGHGLPGTFCPLHQTTDCHCSARSVTACSLCRPAQPGLHPHQHASAPHRNQEHYTVLRALTATLYLSPLQDYTPHGMFCFGISLVPFTGKSKLIWKRCFRTTRTSRSRNTGVEGSGVNWCMAIRHQCSWTLQLLQASRPTWKLRPGPLPFFCSGWCFPQSLLLSPPSQGSRALWSPDYSSSGQTCFPSWKPFLCFLTMACHTGQAICFNYVNHFILFANIYKGASRHYRSK